MQHHFFLLSSLISPGKAKNLVCMDASSSFASAAPGGKGAAPSQENLLIYKPL
jgi:hypothetical protein